MWPRQPGCCVGIPRMSTGAISGHSLTHSLTLHAHEITAAADSLRRGLTQAIPSPAAATTVTAAALRSDCAACYSWCWRSKVDHLRAVQHPAAAFQGFMKSLQASAGGLHADPTAVAAPLLCRNTIGCRSHDRRSAASRTYIRGRAYHLHSDTTPTYSSSCGLTGI